MSQRLTSSKKTGIPSRLVTTSPVIAHCAARSNCWQTRFELSAALARVVLIPEH